MGDGLSRGQRERLQGIGTVIDSPGFPPIPGAAEALARAVWNGPTPLLVVSDEDGTIRAANTAMLDLLGYGADELIGRSSEEIETLLTPAERKRIRNRWDRAFPQQDIAVSLRNRHGVRRDLLISLSAIDLDGCSCTLVQATDVGERRILKEQVARERDRLELVLAGLPVGVVIQTMAGKIISANPAAADVLGLTLDQLHGRTSFDPRWRAVKPDGAPFPGEEHPAMEVIATGEPVDGVVMGIHRPDESLVWLAISSRLLDGAGPDGERAVVTAFIDVTSLEETRRSLTEARDLAEEANRTKTNFLSVISHELRTPLTAVMGYSQMLLAESGGPLMPTQREDLIHITRGADRLLALIDDLLDLGRIQSGRLDLDLDYVDVADIVKGLEPDLRVQATGDGLGFWLLSEPNLTVLADVLRIEQVIINLVSNAVKFTREGEVRVDAVRDGNDVLITVADTGIGIQEDAQERIFELFQQADSTTTRRYSGLGLGLAIAHSIVERHGGTISVESEPGAGSTFSVRLPLA
jgi:two-component system, sensor histidine kinase and response regulator